MINIKKGQLVITKRESAITDKKELGFCYNINDKGCAIIFEYGGDSRHMFRDVEEFIEPLDYIDALIKAYNFESYKQVRDDYEAALFNKSFQIAKEIFAVK